LSLTSGMINLLVRRQIAGKHAIGNKRDGCDWINNGVDVSQPLQKLQSSIATIPDRTMSTKQNFH
jgi:hypothetical protein